MGGHSHDPGNVRFAQAYHAICRHHQSRQLWGLPKFCDRRHNQDDPQGPSRVIKIITSPSSISTEHASAPSTTTLATNLKYQTRLTSEIDSKVILMGHEIVKLL
jgi:hypothetical protein